MSDWNGPGIYRIELKNNRRFRLNQSNGKACIWELDNANDVWFFGLAGVGANGKNEYHIIHNKSGKFLTSPQGAPQGVQCEVMSLSPSDPRTRWSVTPKLYCTETGLYHITPAANPQMYLNLNNNNTVNGNQIWLYSDGEHPSCQWYFEMVQS